MKITIAYLPGEERSAIVIKEFIKGLIPGAKVHESDRRAPYTHIYITTKKPDPTDGSK